MSLTRTPTTNFITFGVKRRVPKAPPACLERPNAAAPTIEQKHGAASMAGQNRTQDEINSGPRLVHERAADDGPLEPSLPAFKPYLVHRDSPMLEDIFAETRKFYRVAKREFFGHCRVGKLPFVRHVAVYLAREMTKPQKSTPEIARMLGGRDHTTCLNSLRRINERLPRDERLRDELQIIQIKINERVAARNAQVQA